MRNSFNKVASACAALGLSLGLLSFSSHAGYNVCSATGGGSGTVNDGGIVVAYFSAPDTTITQALAGLHELRRLHGDTVTINGIVQPVTYDLFYNTTADLMSSNAQASFVDAYRQTLGTAAAGTVDIFADRYEVFSDFLSGLASTWLDALFNLADASDAQRDETLRAAQAMQDAILDILQPRLRTLEAALTAPTPRPLDESHEHRTRLDQHILSGKKLLLVGHGHGNLFVNRAYDYVSTTQLPTEAVRVIHIAPPASANLAYAGAPYVVADRDRIAGSRPDRTPVHVPDFRFEIRNIGFNGRDDLRGHDLIAIYLNTSFRGLGADIAHQSIGRVTNELIQNNLFALAALAQPPAEIANGFFTVTMTWDGTGDVDLHVIEPRAFSGSPRAHVYWSSKQGNSGELDYDNVVSYGPEHYFASCDNDSLRRGEYMIAVRNYSGAAGRTATIMVNDMSGRIWRTMRVRVPDTQNQVIRLATVNVDDDGTTLPDGSSRPVIRAVPASQQTMPYNDWLGLRN